jgi:hypothetical protein
MQCLFKPSQDTFIRRRQPLLCGTATYPVNSYLPALFLMLPHPLPKSDHSSSDLSISGHPSRLRSACTFSWKLFRTCKPQIMPPLSTASTLVGTLTYHLSPAPFHCVPDLTSLSYGFQVPLGPKKWWYLLLHKSSKHMLRSRQGTIAMNVEGHCCMSGFFFFLRPGFIM